MKKQGILGTLQLWSKQDQESDHENHKCSYIQIQCEIFRWTKMAERKMTVDKNDCRNIIL